MIWKFEFWNEPVKLVHSGPDVPRAKMQQSAIVSFGLNMLKRRIIFAIPKKTNGCKRNGKKQ